MAIAKKEHTSGPLSELQYYTYLDKTNVEGTLSCTRPARNAAKRGRGDAPALEGKRRNTMYTTRMQGKMGWVAYLGVAKITAGW